MAPVTETVRIGAEVPAEVVERLREIAIEHERSLSAQVRVALREWIEQQDAETA